MIDLFPVDILREFTVPGNEPPVDDAACVGLGGYLHRGGVKEAKDSEQNTQRENGGTVRTRKRQQRAERWANTFHEANMNGQVGNICAAQGRVKPRWRRGEPRKGKGGEVHGPVSEHAKRKKGTRCSMPRAG